ncbi:MULTISPECIES: AAA family ATPase [unclassified Microcoleus]|uniref:AAA family ATPase n=1 Tax=unclassified Microcoleus TaxID=2642155 RepID=UPI002FD06AE2
MIILINGSFGVGKTTVARLLVKRIPNSMLFDPEIIGFVLRRLPKFIPLKGRTFEDFQDIVLWRQLTILTALSLDKIGFKTIIIPMTFSNLDYLNQIRSAFVDNGIAVRHFCLTASVEVVRDRLMRRGVNASSAAGKWVYPRAEYCCEIHAKPEFREHIVTDENLPSDVADDIIDRIRALANES